MNRTVTFSIVGKTTAPDYPMMVIIFALEDLIERLEETQQKGGDMTGAFTVESKLLKLQFSAVDRRND
jgi:hypothetical protein